MELSQFLTLMAFVAASAAIVFLYVAMRLRANRRNARRRWKEYCQREGLTTLGNE